MTPEPADSSAVQVIVVAASDVVAAVETNETSGTRAVLRLTPPFSGRMRARLHVEHGGEYDSDPQPIHVDPGTLLGADAPSYPRPADTEATLRADPDRSYTVERHHDRHTRAVEEWRARLPAGVRDRVTITTPEGTHEVSVSVLEDLGRAENGR